MAAVVNERDVMIRGAASRVEDVSLPTNVQVPALKALLLSAPSTTFRVANGGATEPSGIVITATLRHITGSPAVTWSLSSGTATLTGSGNSRTLSAANMTSDFVTVKAQVDVAGTIYSDEISFVKIQDGSIGQDGRRGSLSVVKSTTGTTWSDAIALQALQEAGAAFPIAADECTLFNTAQAYSERRRYDGNAWVAAPASLPGTAIMAGTLSGTAFAQGIEPVKVVTSVPGTKNGNTLYNSTDGKLYRWDATLATPGYVATTDAEDVVGQLTAGQIAAGAIKADQLDASAVTAAKIAANAVTSDKIFAGAITTEKLLVTSLGLAINSDPSTQDISAWIGSGISIVADSTSPIGGTVLACTATAATVLSKPFDIDATKNYRLSIWIKQQSGTTPTYLTAVFKNASGAVVNGSGWPAASSYNYFGLISQQPSTTWTEYVISFGPNETAKIGTGAKTMQIGLLSNYTGTGEQRVTGVRVVEKTTGDMVVDGTITAGKIDSRGLSIKDASGNVILAAGSALDWGMVGGVAKPADNAGRVLDTRSVNSPPSSYAVGNHREFKTCSAIGITTTATYCVLETIKGWNDSSGGEATQWAYVTSGEVWKRSALAGASSWGAWIRDVDRALYTGDLNATNGAAVGVNLTSGGATVTANQVLNGVQDGTVTRIAAPAGGTYSNIGGAVTGAIKIALPQSWTSTMMRFRVDVFDYSAGGNVTYEIGGYNYADSPSWYSVTATAVGSPSKIKAVRFGHDGTKCCIWIGEVNSTHSYPSVRVYDFMAGYLNYSVGQWDDGWVVSLVTAFATVNHVITDPKPGGAFSDLDQITAANISTYIAAAAIGTAYIGDAAITQAKIGTAAVGSAQIANAAIDSAHIKAAAIDTVHIADAQITSAKIVDANVTTLKIAGNAVTVPVGVSASDTVRPPNTETTAMSLSIDPGGGSVIVLVDIRVKAGSSVTETLAPTIRLKRNGVVLRTTAGPATNGYEPIFYCYCDSPGAGTHTYTLTIETGGISGSGGYSTRSLVLLGAKR